MSTRPDHHEPEGATHAVARQRKLWNRQAPRYDRQIAFWERHLFDDARAWTCARASGSVLEVAAGTARNLPYYSADIQFTGLDVSPAMLDIAADRARDLGRTVQLDDGDAHALPYDDATFDTVVCTFSLCNIPDHRRAITEMYRVLRPGGTLLLADHVVSTSRPIAVLQKVIEKATFWLVADSQTRRPMPLVVDTGFVIDEQRRYKKGIVELIQAHKPS
ncbi:methyltransferase domain-containing protein [Actinobacteria bacterium YIM 96077]|uniref:SAM-dependent methyltransferase n=1 Tax=Phytoactinopolyspora halophila TaxID=1981511 RepID=A0A329R237_9ACTN|nr:class I SAM-dependent methyltransferase [Phytoactinopolyspora halophila]AYY13219.1 methyltransferase domain-containing protein [Actinobacteria bacterium YIM 96077]RAW17542.1 SAM-dependent methyltransferase [Phytoactinopolyspora halophila]